MIRILLVCSFLTMVVNTAVAKPPWDKPIDTSVSNYQKQSDNLSLVDVKIGQALKEVLSVGVSNTIKLVGKADGFYANKAIKIGLPQKLHVIDKPLRVMGFGRQIDDLVLSMNRAAEKTVPLAKGRFLEEIIRMKMGDVQTVFKGEATAATDYLKQKTYDQLRKDFAPVVKHVLKDLRVIKKYRDLLARYDQIAFSQKFSAPLIEDYVTEKTLDGLFLVLAQQEVKIRQDPSARSTSLLKEVFSGNDESLK